MNECCTDEKENDTLTVKRWLFFSILKKNSTTSEWKLLNWWPQGGESSAGGGPGQARAARRALVRLDAARLAPGRGVGRRRGAPALGGQRSGRPTRRRRLRPLPTARPLRPQSAQSEAKLSNHLISGCLDEMNSNLLQVLRTCTEIFNSVMIYSLFDRNQ